MQSTYCSLSLCDVMQGAHIAPCTEASIRNLPATKKTNSRSLTIFLVRFSSHPSTCLLPATVSSIFPRDFVFFSVFFCFCRACALVSLAIVCHVGIGRAPRVVGDSLPSSRPPCALYNVNPVCSVCLRPHSMAGRRLRFLSDPSICLSAPLWKQHIPTFLGAL